MLGFISSVGGRSRSTNPNSNRPPQHLVWSISTINQPKLVPPHPSLNTTVSRCPLCPLLAMWTNCRGSRSPRLILGPLTVALSSTKFEGVLEQQPPSVSNGAVTAWRSVFRYRDPDRVVYFNESSKFTGGVHCRNCSPGAQFVLCYAKEVHVSQGIGFCRIDDVLRSDPLRFRMMEVDISEAEENHRYLKFVN